MALKSALNRERTRGVRRQQILDAALDSIAENGLADTTLATVAKKAGLSQASLVFHFKTKDALLTEPTTAECNEFCQLVQQEADRQLQKARAGAQAICICCTEFSLVAKHIQAPVPVFDALDLLVGATVRFARDGTLPDASSAATAASTFNREKETT